jgi:hypothetical protein
MLHTMVVIKNAVAASRVGKIDDRNQQCSRTPGTAAAPHNL